MPEGETPLANVNWRFKWLWLYAFVHPQTGETFWWILPYVNTELFSRVLADFAREFKLGAKKHVLLAVDALSPKNLAALIKRVPDYAHRSTNRRLPDFLRVRPRDQAGWHISKDLEVPAMFTFNAFTIPFPRITTCRKIVDFG